MSQVGNFVTVIILAAFFICIAALLIILLINGVFKNYNPYILVFFILFVLFVICLLYSKISNSYFAFFGLIFFGIYLYLINGDNMEPNLQNVVSQLGFLFVIVSILPLLNSF